MSIKLRTKKTKDGSESLYLDIYYKGQRKYEFLGLSIKKNDPNKKNIKELAEKRRSQKELEIFANAYNLPNYYNGKEDFIKYYESKCKDGAYRSSLERIKEFAKNRLIGEKLPFNKVDEKFCDDYKNWLFSKEYKNNTVWVTILKLKTVLNNAVKEKIIPINPAKYVSVKLEETEKQYLTFEELQLMYAKGYEDKELYRAFLFACYTGLRLSDIKALTWGQIREGKIFFRQKKTKGIEYLPISESALNVLNLFQSDEAKQDAEKKVFTFKAYASDTFGINLTEWALDAKVNKKITFHTSRHTFATLSLTYGVDLYTVSKLLGHKSITNTQIYAKIINKKADEAIKKLPTL